MAAQHDRYAYRTTPAERDRIRSGVGRIIRELRRERGYTIQVLAERSAVHRNTVLRIEHGWRRPGTTALHAIANGLDPDNVSQLYERLCQAAGEDLRETSAGWAHHHRKAIGQVLRAGRYALPAEMATRVRAYERATQLRSEAAELRIQGADPLGPDGWPHKLTEAADLERRAGGPMVVKAKGYYRVYGMPYASAGEVAHSGAPVLDPAATADKQVQQVLDKLDRVKAARAMRAQSPGASERTERTYGGVSDAA